MASITVSKKGCRRILFYDATKARRAVHLGKCSQKYAEKVKTRVESMLVASILGSPIDQDDATWLANAEGDKLRDQFAKVGLVDAVEPEPAKPKVLLSSFLDDFLLRNGPGKKPATLVVWGQVVRMLKTELPEGIAVADVTVGHAKELLNKLQARVKKGELQSSTVHKRISFARQFFQDAVDWEIIERNPFTSRSIKTSSPSTKSNVDVPPETVKTILKHCDATWAAIVGLSRYGGLRCPSETLSLKWGDIDWDNYRMSIPEPKVEHHEGRGIRSCPLFPELRTILEALFKEATIDRKPPSPDSYVIGKQAYRNAAMRPGGWANANLRTQFLKILRRAGVSPWNRLFHSMRASRQTELERQFPLHVVCSWLGNTEAVAKKSYLLVTDADFAKAIETQTPPLEPKEPLERETNGARAGSKRGTNGALQTPETTGSKKKKAREITGKSYVFLQIPRLSKWRRGELNNRHNPCISTHFLKRETNGARAFLRALASIKQSRQALERLIDQTDIDDENTLGRLASIASELRAAQSTLEKLSQLERKDS